MAENSTPIADYGSGLYFPNSSNTWRNNGGNDLINVGGGRVTISTSGALLRDAVSFADDLVLNCPSAGGMTILSGTEGLIYFGDAASSQMGRIRYLHSTDSFNIYTGSNVRNSITTSGTFEFADASDTTPTLLNADFSSGALFLSGGDLWYKGFAGTSTKLAAS